MGGVVFGQMGDRLQIRQLIDGDDLDMAPVILRFIQGTQNTTPDTSITIDGNF